MGQDSIYVAAASDELDRARIVMGRLRELGFDVTSTWPEQIAAVGVSNPRDADRTQRARWAFGQLKQVADAGTLLLLAPIVPPAIAPGRGAYTELGYAVALNKLIVASGDTRQSIFTAVAAHEFEFDDDAVAWLCLRRDRIREREIAAEQPPGDTWSTAIGSVSRRGE